MLYRICTNVAQTLIIVSGMHTHNCTHSAYTFGIAMTGWISFIIDILIATVADIGSETGCRATRESYLGLIMMHDSIITIDTDTIGTVALVIAAHVTNHAAPIVPIMYA